MVVHTRAGCTCTGKRCPSCEQVKCRGAFDRSLLRLDGLQPYCRECRLAKRRESRPWRKEASRKADKQWHQNHREYYKQRQKAYYEANPNKRREYYEANREKYRELNRAYHEANPDRHREQMRAYQRNNLESFAVRNANRHAHKIKAGGSFTLQEWEALKAYYDYTCLRQARTRDRTDGRSRGSSLTGW